MPHRFLSLVALGLVAALSPLVGVGPALAEQPIGSLPTASDFVTQQYEDFLSRAPDEAGLTYWTEQLDNGLDPSALVESLSQSAEFEGTMAPLVRLYYAHFNRAPDYEGLNHWAGVARRGWSMAQISEEFVKSQEFELTYGALSDEQYIDQVYANVLGRSADAGGRAHWTQQLDRGMSRGEAMVAFSDSAEYRGRTKGRVQATMLYVGMLRRAPENTGLGYWAEVIGDGTPYRNVIAGFLGAQEYQGRIGRLYHEVDPLTGVPTRQTPRRPALAVKIDNVDQARPPTNVEHADLVYEEMVEGNLTRLIAVFHSKVPDVIGPVRSIRTTDLDILSQFNTPLLAASGANSAVLAAVATADVVNVNALVAGNAYFRQPGRRAPHNMFTRPAALFAAAKGQGGGLPPQLFRYRSPGVAPVGGVAANGVAIRFGRANINFEWSTRHQGWVRSQNGTAHTTAAGKRLAPANVVVLEVEYGVSPADAQSPEAHTVGSGTAHVLTAGQRVTGTWSRDSSDAAITLTDGNGDEIPLSRGRTFIELAPQGSIQLR